jgi:hypothetical protein
MGSQSQSYDEADEIVFVSSSPEPDVADETVPTQGPVPPLITSYSSIRQHE